MRLLVVGERANLGVLENSLSNFLNDLPVAGKVDLQPVCKFTGLPFLKTNALFIHRKQLQCQIVVMATKLSSLFLLQLTLLQEA
jgi:hypothetical protein